VKMRSPSFTSSVIREDSMGVIKTRKIIKLSAG